MTAKKLPAILDNLDGLDPAHRDLYRPGDGDLVDRFVLDIEEVDGFGLANTGQAVSGTRNARAAEKAAKAEAAKFAAQLKQAQEQIAALQEQVESGVPDAKQLRESLNATLKRQYDSVLASKESEWKEQHDAATRKAEALAKQIARAEFRAQLASVTDFDFPARVMEPHLIGRTRPEFDEESGSMRLIVLDANGEPKLVGGKPATMRDLVAEFSSDREFSSLIAKKDGQPKPGSQPRQGGSRSGGSGPVVITREQARDARFYREQQKLAADTGREFVVLNNPESNG